MSFMYNRPKLAVDPILTDLKMKQSQVYTLAKYLAEEKLHLVTITSIRQEKNMPAQEDMETQDININLEDHITPVDDNEDESSEEGDEYDESRDSLEMFPSDIEALESSGERPEGRRTGTTYSVVDVYPPDLED